MAGKKKTKRVADFNGVVVKFNKFTKNHFFFLNNPSFNPDDGIGIAFTDDEDIRGYCLDYSLVPFLDTRFVNVVFKSNNCLQHYRFTLSEIKIVSRNVPQDLKEETLKIINNYHNHLKYMSNLNYLEALDNINKMRVK